jgi:hypothetical protein
MFDKKASYNMLTGGSRVSKSITTLLGETLEALTERLTQQDTGQN